MHGPINIILFCMFLVMTLGGHSVCLASRCMLPGVNCRCQRIKVMVLCYPVGLICAVLCGRLCGSAVAVDTVTVNATTELTYPTVEEV